MTPATSPPLVEYLADYLRRRKRSDLPVAPGEAVTLTVGLLRGCRRAEDRGQGSAWALNARGCPVLVEESDGDDALGVTATALSGLAELMDDDGRERIERARDTVLTRPPRAWEEAERRLFAWAEPTPLVLGPLAPRADDFREPPRSSPLPRSLPAVIDGDVPAMLFEAASEAWGRWRRWRHARAFSFGFIAMGTGAALGLLLPTTAHSPAPAIEATPSVSASEPEGTPDADAPATPFPSVRPTLLDPGGPTPLLATATPTPSPTEITPSPGSIVDAARALLTAYAACAGQISCEQNLREGRADPGEAIPEDPEEARISLVDDFGGIAVVRVDGEGEPDYVTLVREKDRWLVRAVRTVTDQPS